MLHFPKYDNVGYVSSLHRCVFKVAPYRYSANADYLLRSLKRSPDKMFRREYFPHLKPICLFWGQVVVTICFVYEKPLTLIVVKTACRFILGLTKLTRMGAHLCGEHEIQ